MNEAELRRAAVVLETYKAQLESLVRQQEILRLSLEEHMRTHETVTKFKEAGKGAEILAPVGANVFVRGEIKDVHNVIYGIGSDVLVEGPIDEAIARISERMKYLSEGSSSLSAKAAEMEERVKAQTEFVERTYEALRASSEQKK